MTALDIVSRPRPAKLTVEDFLLPDRLGAFDSYAKSELIDGTIFVVNAAFGERLAAAAIEGLAVETGGLS